MPIQLCTILRTIDCAAWSTASNVERKLPSNNTSSIMMGHTRISDVVPGTDAIAGVPECAYFDRLRKEQMALRAALRASADAPERKRRRSDVEKWVMQ